MKKIHLLVGLTLLILISCEKNKENNNSVEEPLSGRSKQEIIDFYNNDYLGSNTSGNDWTGNTQSCVAGTISKEAQDNTLKRINYFRVMAYLPKLTGFEDDLNKKCQKAALMMYANKTLNHFPPTSWSCYSDDGAEAASHSNIATNSTSAAISSYMSDHGTSNYSVGHRRWILYPKTKTMGHGSASSYDVLWVFGGSVQSETPSDMPEFVAWPPRGYVPANVIYDRWSFSIPKADFSSTSISMTDKSGGSISLEIRKIENGYGDNTIVWEPNFDYGFWSEDETVVHINIKNVKLNGETKNYEYDVISIIP